MTYSKIKKRLLDQFDLFRDESFPANNRVLCQEHRQENISWKRPRMIVKEGEPYFIVNKASRFDFDQGALGDCWFISAAATLASSHSGGFEKVVPRDQGFQNEYAGIFRFRFWSYGTWREVIIDDYLPCTDRGLLYCRNKEEPNEFWAALLEKAYAKFYGSYENLRGGYIHYALVDLTGGITEVLDTAKYKCNPAAFYDLLYRTYQMTAFLGAAIFKPSSSRVAREIEQKNGLFMGHAYSITGFQTLNMESGLVRLLRLRNPWGSGEWKGRWSDQWIKASNISRDNRRQLQTQIRVDGEFWIACKDFVKNFNQVQMCHLTPDSMTSEVTVDMKRDDWKMVDFHGSWRMSEAPTPGCCGSSSQKTVQFHQAQYLVNLSDMGGRQCPLVVSLIEKEARNSTDPPIYINFSLYQVQANLNHPLTSRDKRRSHLVGRGADMFVYYKEVAQRFSLAPGFYVIIPQTYRKDAEAEFYIRVYTKHSVNVRELITEKYR